MEADCLTLGGGESVTSLISFRMPNLTESLPVNRIYRPPTVIHLFSSVRHVLTPVHTNNRSTRKLISTKIY